MLLIVDVGILWMFGLTVVYHGITIILQPLLICIE